MSRIKCPKCNKLWMKSSELFRLGVVSMKRQMTILRTGMRALQIFVLNVKQNLKRPILWSHLGVTFG